MINMDKKEQILHYHRIDGLSLREIARRVGLNRKTVTRYIREYEVRVQADPEEGVDLCLASEPRYPARKAERTRLTEPVCAEIEYWLHILSQKYTIFATKFNKKTLFVRFNPTTYFQRTEKRGLLHHLAVVVVPLPEVVTVAPS